MTSEFFKPPYLPPIHAEDVIETAPPPISYPETPAPIPNITTPTPPPPMEVTPVNKVEYQSTTNTDYTLVIYLTPSYGKVILLKEISIAPLTSDSATYGRYYLKIDDNIWSEKQLGATLTIPYDWKIYAKKEIVIMHRTTDSSYTIQTNAIVTGIECREIDIPKVRGFLVKNKI